MFLSIPNIFFTEILRKNKIRHMVNFKRSFHDYIDILLFVYWLPQKVKEPYLSYL